MKKLALMAIAGLIWLAAPTAAPAQATKPLVVVSVTSTNNLLKKVDYLATLMGPAGQNFATMVRGPAAIAGQLIDVDKPMGLVANLDAENNPVVVGFIPTKDFQGAVQFLGGFGAKSEDVGDGVTQLTMEGNPPVFVKGGEGWTYIAQAKEALANPPANPSELLAELQVKYDVAAQVNMQSLPEGLKQQIFDAVNTGLAQANAQQGLDPTDPNAIALRQIQAKQVEQMKEVLNDLDAMTIGWAIDPNEKSTYIDMSVTVVEGSKLIQQFEGMKNATTQFSGFMPKDAVAFMNASTKLGQQDIEQTTQMLGLLRKNIHDEIQKSEQFPDDATKDFVEGMANDFIDVLDATIRSGKFDMALSLTGGQGAKSLIGAAHIAQGQKLAKALEKLLKLAAKEEDKADIKLNVANEAGATFHTITPDKEPDADAKRIFGDNPNVTLGVSGGAFYFAVSANGVSVLKSAIEASKAAGATDVKPFELSASVKAIAEMAAEENPQAGAVAAMIQGNDRISLRADVIDRGARYRFEIQDGVLKAIGGFAGQLLPPGVGGPPGGVDPDQQ